MKKTTITISELFYLLFLGSMLLAKGLGLVEGEPAYTVLLTIGMVCFACKLVLTKYSRFEILWIAILLLHAGIVYLRSGERGIVFAIMMIVGIKGCDFRRVMKVLTVLWTTCFFLMMALTQSGLLQDLFLVHNKGALGYVVRWSFGYTHPNVMHISYLVLCALLLYSCDFPVPATKESTARCLRISLLLMIGNLYVTLYSISYTGFLMVTFLLALNLYLYLRKSGAHPIMDTLLQAIMPLSVLFTVAGPVVLKGSLYELADKIVHHRFVLSNYFLTTEPICFFGHRLLTTPDANRSLDCSYVYLFVHMGVIMFILILSLTFLALKDLLKQQQSAGASLVVALSVAGITEPFLYNTSFKNLIFLFIGWYLFAHSAAFMKEASTAGGFERSLLQSLFGTRFFRGTVGPALSERVICVNGMAGDRLKTYFDKLITCMKQRRIVLFLVASVGAILIMILYATCLPRPTSVAIPASYCADGFESEPVSMTSKEIQGFGKDVRVLYAQTTDEPVSIAIFTGKTASLEYVRGIISCGMWAFLFFYVAGAIIMNTILHKQEV